MTEEQYFESALDMKGRRGADVHEEQYFESIEEVKLEEQRRAETRRDAQIIARSGAVAIFNDQSEASETRDAN